METELACNSDSSVDNNNNNNSSSTVSTRRRVPPSSSLSLLLPVKTEEVANTIIRRQVVKKEEEGVEEEAYNNHDDNNDDNDKKNGTTNCDDLNRGQVQAVRKEEEKEENDDDHYDDENKETQIPSRSIDDNYDDWMNGNWCWLLSATNDKSNAMNKTRHSKSAVSYITNHSGALEDGDTKNTTNNNIAATTTTTTTGILVAATSTTRHRSYDDNDDEIIKPPPKKKMRHCRQPINYNDREEEEEEVEDSVYEHNANNPLTNDNNDSSSSSSSSSSKNEGNDEEGYESWTKGNWCWLLPFPTTVDKIETGRSSTRRIRMGVNIGGGDPYEDGDSGNEDADTDTDNDNDVLSAKSKTRKNKMKYTTWQNERFDEMFRRLEVYNKANKSTIVPFGYEADPSLGYWVSRQREKGNNKIISAVRIRRLNSIGFVWKIKEYYVPWMEMYRRLVAYKKKHNSTIVPTEYQADPRLGNWVQAQRTIYNRKELHIDRINHLESIDFVWDPRDAQWMEIYDRLVAYKMQHDSTAVPYDCTEDPFLGKWVSTQRFFFNKGKLSGKRLKLLNSINFIWSMYAKKAI